MSESERFQELIESAVAELGKELTVDTSELAVYAAERSSHLATLVNDPDFDIAVRAERDAVALKAGIILTNESDSADFRLVGIIQGAIHFAALAV